MDRGNIKGFNGVSYGAVITAVAQDDTDGAITGTFSGPSDTGTPYPLAFSVTVVDGSNVVVDLADAVLTFNSPNNGDFSIADGGATFAVTAGQVFHITASPAREE